MTVVQDGQNGNSGDPGLRRIFEEIRVLQRELRDDRRQAAAAAAADRRQAAEDRRQAAEERRRADEKAERWEADRKRSDERFERHLREFREDSLRAAVATQKAWRDLRTVGLSIVKTLNRHTRLLEGIDRKLGGRRNGGRPGNGRSA